MCYHVCFCMCVLSPVSQCRLRLPGVLIVYTLISSSVLQVAWIISYTDTKSLYCSHSGLGEAIADTTPFCYLIGPCDVS